MGLVACWTAWGFPLRAESDPASTLRLQWHAPPECPSSSEILAEAARLLGGPPAPPAGETWTANATVTHRDIWSVELELRTRGVQRRRLQARTCRGLADATALILALMIDPDAVAARSAASSAAEDGAASDAGESDAQLAAEAPVLPEPPAGTAAPHAAASGSEEHTQGSYGPPLELPFSATAPESANATDGGVSPAASGPSHFSLQAPFVIEAGPLPGIEYGVGAGLGLRLGSLRFEASFTEWLPSAVATVTAPEGAGGTFRMISGALDACYVFEVGHFEVGPCALLDAGRVEAAGRGVSHTSTAYVPWIAAGGGAFTSATLDRAWAIPLHLDLVVPLARNDYAIQNVASVVYRPSAVGGRLSVAVEFRFF
jgi:hypothetical protein